MRVRPTRMRGISRHRPRRHHTRVSRRVASRRRTYEKPELAVVATELDGRRERRGGQREGGRRDDGSLCCARCERMRTMRQYPCAVLALSARARARRRRRRPRLARGVASSSASPHHRRGIREFDPRAIPNARRPGTQRSTRARARYIAHKIIHAIGASRTPFAHRPTRDPRSFVRSFARSRARGSRDRIAIVIAIVRTFVPPRRAVRGNARVPS